MQSAGESTEEEGTQERGDPPQDGSAARFWGDERKARSSHRGHQLSGQRDKGLQQGCLHMGQDVRLRAVGALCLLLSENEANSIGNSRDARGLTGVGSYPNSDDP